MKFVICVSLHGMHGFQFETSMIRFQLRTPRVTVLELEEQVFTSDVLCIAGCSNREFLLHCLVGLVQGTHSLEACITAFHVVKVQHNNVAQIVVCSKQRERHWHCEKTNQQKRFRTSTVLGT